MCIRDRLKRGKRFIKYKYLPRIKNFLPVLNCLKDIRMSITLLRKAFTSIHIIRPFSLWCFGILWSQLTPRYELFVARTFGALPRPPRVRHKSFTAQPLDLLSWRYVYFLGFDLFRNLTRHLASYPVSVRRLNGFATPLPPPLNIAVFGLWFATLGGKYP